MSLHRVKQVFRQDPHCCADPDIDGTIELELFDGGGGEYLVMRACEWAVDDQKEVDELAKEMKAMMETAKVKS